MSSTLYLVLGGFMLVMAAGYLAGWERLVRPKFRNRRGLRAYMRLSGIAYGLVGIVGLLIYFLDDSALSNRAISIPLAVVTLGALILLIFANHSFVNRDP